MSTRTFVLQRDVDVSGVSGTGVVAHGVVFDDATVVLRWEGKHQSTVIWRSIDDVIAVHGHDGRTNVVWTVEEDALHEELRAGWDQRLEDVRHEIHRQAVSKFRERHRESATSVVLDVLAERDRAVSLGFDADHDDRHSVTDLVHIAGRYVTLAHDAPAGTYATSSATWNRERLVKATGLLLATLERLDREVG